MTNSGKPAAEEPGGDNRGDTGIEQGGAPVKAPAKQNKLWLKIVLGIAGFCFLLCGLAVVVLLYQFGHTYFEPKNQIIIEADPSQVSIVYPSDLQAAADILNARCRAIACDFSFLATGNNQIVAQVPRSLDAETVVGKMIAVGLLEFVDFGETAVAPGTSVRTDVDYPYLSQVEGTTWHTVMTNDGFESVSLTTDAQGRVAIAFILTASGTKTFSDFTTNNIGHYLGIVLDKTVISCPVVNAPIHDGNGIIQGSFTHEEARILASYLETEGPLPVPLKISQIIENSK